MVNHLLWHIAKYNITKENHIYSLKLVMDSQLLNILGKQRIILERSVLKNTLGPCFYFSATFWLVEVNEKV